MPRQYGTWADLELGWRTVWDHVDDACGWSVTVKQYETIVTRYIDGINDELPDDVYLEDSVFYGPGKWVSVDLKRSVEAVDLLAIVEEVVAEDA